MPNYTHSPQESNHTDKDCMLGNDNEITERGLAVNVAYGMIAVLAFASNLVFCLAMKRKRNNLKTSHDLLIYTLAIADTLTGKRIIVLRVWSKKIQNGWQERSQERSCLK